MARPQRSLLLDTIALAFAGAAVVGLVVRWTVRDSLPVASSVFYAMPMLVVAGMLGFASLAFFGGRRRVASLVCVVSALAAAGLWLHATAFGHPCDQERDGTTILFWNAARGFNGWPEVADYVAGVDADIIGLVEAGGSSDERREFWGNRFPQYDVYLAGGGLLVMVRGEIVERHVLQLAGRSNCADVEIAVGGRHMRLLLLDAVVRPFSNRRQIVEKVFELARSRPELPTIVMGDFNTPVDSVWFEPVRHGFSHVFESAGSGMLTTWPVPVPILAIDHIWVSRQLRTACARIGWSWLSDHRPVMARVTLAPPSPIDGDQRP